MSRIRKSSSESPLPSSDRWPSLLMSAFVALVVAQTLMPEDPGGRLGLGVPLDMLWLLLAAAWLLGQLRRDRWRLRFAWPDGLLVALVAWHSIAAIVAIYTGSPRPAMNVLWDWVAIGLVFLLTRQVLPAERDVRAMIVVMIGLACGLSAVAVHQYLVTIPADVAAYDAAQRSVETLYEATGQWLEPGSSERMRFEARLNSRLPAATLALSNSLAGLLTPWLVLLVALATDLRPRWRGGVAFALALLVVACVWLTGSRTAGVAIGAGLLLVAADRALVVGLSKKTWIAAMAGLLVSLAVVVAAVAGTSLGARLADAAWRSLAFRFEYWQATLAMIADNPLLGCGPGQFQDTYTAYKLVGAAEEIQDPHNWLLEVWATAGTPAAVLLVATIAAVIFRCRRARHAASLVDPSAAPPSALDATLFGGVGGGLLGAMLAWISGYPLARTHLLLLVAAIAGVWFLFGDWTRNGKLAQRLPLWAAVALLVNLFTAGGIGFPAVADSLWLLLAMQLNLVGPPADGAWTLEVARSLRWLAGLGLAAALVTAIWFEYLPVMRCRVQMPTADAARAAGAAGPYRAALNAALEADPWSRTAAAQLAAQSFADYQSLPTATQIRSLRAADARARALAPRSSGTWAESAGFAAAIFRDTRRVEDRKAAERYYARALALYPTNAQLQAEVARFWQQLGQSQRARDAAAEALRIDDAQRAAGHRDRVLDDASRDELQALAKSPR